MLQIQILLSFNYFILIFQISFISDTETQSSQSQLRFTARDLEPQLNNGTKQCHIIIPDPNHICPCILCPNTKFSTRDEQLKHYHTENHLQRLKDYCASKIHEPLTIQAIYKNKTDEDDNKSLFTNYTTVEDEPKFYCQVCNQYFNTESALDHHYTTNKHKTQKQKEQQSNE